jgi:hypothetical protein
VIAITILTDINDIPLFTSIQTQTQTSTNNSESEEATQSKPELEEKTSNFSEKIDFSEEELKILEEVGAADIDFDLDPNLGLDLIITFIDFFHFLTLFFFKKDMLASEIEENENLA